MPPNRDLGPDVPLTPPTPLRPQRVFRGVWRALIALAGPSALTAAAAVTVTPDHANGIYQIGESIQWTVAWHGPNPAPRARYTLKSGGLTLVREGELCFADGPATLTASLAEPNTLLVEIAWPEGDQVARARGGAVAAPERIAPAAPPPPDFDAFWRTRTEELKHVPINPRLVERSSDRPGVRYWQVRLDNVAGSHVQGQLARPATGDELPALLILQYAGVYGLKREWVTERAAEGWLTLNILAHDLPVDQPEQFYAAQAAGPLKDYWKTGNDDPGSSYYLRMYLSCLRAVDYLQSRPDWNGRTLVVMGTSQGGQQALALAGLRPRVVSAVLALVPAAGDMLAPDVGRAPGFPRWYFQTDGRDPAGVREAGRYYDPANFAHWITCPVLIGLGLRDEELAPASSVLAVANNLASPKEVMILVQAGHENENGSQERYLQRRDQEWLPALRQGRRPPATAQVRSRIDRDWPTPLASFEAQ